MNAEPGKIDTFLAIDNLTVEYPLGGDIAKTTELFGMEPVMVFTLRMSNPIGSAITIIFVAVIAALYPALKASRAHPVDALRSL